MSYIVHPTVHSNIFFAGGDLFSQECLEHYDGLLAFAHDHNHSLFHLDAVEATRSNSIGFPNIFYGVGADSNRLPSLRRQENMIYYGLDKLSSEGCRHIVFHGGPVADATYVEGARNSVRAIAGWINLHPGTIDDITLIDLDDDYYLRFGHLLPWTDGHIRRTARNGSEFERYFDEQFKNDVERRYNINYGLADRMLNEADEKDLFYDDDSFNFSIGVFYMNLIPQAIAKVTGSANKMHDFLKCAGWPEISCGGGGPMHSDVVLRDSGLFPDDDKLSEWKKTILNELEFFKNFTREVLAGDIWQPLCPASRRLMRSSATFAEKSINEIHSLVCDYIKCLNEGTEPTHIVFGEKIYKKMSSISELENISY